MRVDRYQTPHRSQWHGRPVFFCSAGCKQSFDADPDAYADRLRGTLGGRPRGLLKEPS
jgi:Cu+-exporting ATPase